MSDSPPASSSLTAELARRVLSYKSAPLEGDVLRAAKHCLLDWTAVALAAIDEPVARILRENYEGTSRGDITVLGSPRGFAAADAALVNGATSHALDYDD